MTLMDTTHFPPGGYPFFQPEIMWRAPADLAMMGLTFVAKALQTARAQNPWSGLDPSYEACLEAVKQFTCARLHNDPKFCGPQDPLTPMPRNSTGCAGCGR